jgi:hypothetical protein
MNMPSDYGYIVPKLRLALYDCRITYPERWGITHVINFGILGKHSFKI